MPALQARDHKSMSVSAAAMTAKVWPSVFTKMIRFAGDCGAAPTAFVGEH